MKRFFVLAILGLALTACRLEAVEYRVRALSAVATAQAEAGDVAGARETIALAIESLRHAGDLNSSHLSDTWAAVAWAQVKAGDAADAFNTVTLFVDAKKRPRILSKVALAQAQTGDTAGARATFARVIEAEVARTEGKCRDTLAEMALRQAEAGDAEGARNTAGIAAATVNECSGSVTATEIVVTQAVLGDRAGALRAAKTIGNDVTRRPAVFAVAALQAQAGERASAVRTLAAVPEFGTTKASTRDKESVLAMRLAKAWVRALAGDEAGARATTAEVIAAVRSGAKPEDLGIWLASAAAVQIESGDETAARATLTAALDAVETTESQDERTAAVVWTAALHHVLGDASGAWRAVARIEKPDERVDALAFLASVQGDMGDAAAAERAVDLALAAARSIDDTGRDTALFKVALAQLSLGWKVAAVETLQSGRNLSSGSGDEFWPTDLGRIFATLARGDVAGAARAYLRIAAEISRVGESRIVLPRVLAQTGDAAAGRDVALNMTDGGDSGRIVQRIAALRARLGDVDGALETARRSAKASYRVSALVAVALAHAEAGRSDAATVALNRARGEAGNLQRGLVRDRALASIGAALARVRGTGQPKAGGAAKAVSVDQVSPAHGEVLRLVAAAAERRARGDIAGLARDLERARVTAASIGPAHGRSRAFADVARAQAALGDLARARKIVASALAGAAAVRDATLHALLLPGLAEVQAMAGDAPGALATIGRALEAAEAETAPYYRALALVGIAEAQFTAGTEDAARATAAQALAVAERIPVEK